MDNVQPVRSRETLRTPRAHKDSRRRGDPSPDFHVDGEAPPDRDGASRDDERHEALPVSAPADDEAGARLDLSA